MYICRTFQFDCRSIFAAKIEKKKIEIQEIENLNIVTGPNPYFSTKVVILLEPS